jgi:hypothetical protein
MADKPGDIDFASRDLAGEVELLDSLRLVDSLADVRRHMAAREAIADFINIAAGEDRRALPLVALPLEAGKEWLTTVLNIPIYAEDFAAPGGIREAIRGRIRAMHREARPGGPLAMRMMIARPLPKPDKNADVFFGPDTPRITFGIPPEFADGSGGAVFGATRRTARADFAGSPESMAKPETLSDEEATKIVADLENYPAKPGFLGRIALDMARDRAADSTISVERRYAALGGMYVGDLPRADFAGSLDPELVGKISEKIAKVCTPPGPGLGHYDNPVPWPDGFDHMAAAVLATGDLNPCHGVVLIRDNQRKIVGLGVASEWRAQAGNFGVSVFDEKNRERILIRKGIPGQHDAVIVYPAEG